MGRCRHLNVVLEGKVEDVSRYTATISKRSSTIPSTLTSEAVSCRPESSDTLCFQGINDAKNCCIPFRVLLRSNMFAEPSLAIESLMKKLRNTAAHHAYVQKHSRYHPRPHLRARHCLRGNQPQSSIDFY